MCKSLQVSSYSLLPLRRCLSALRPQSQTPKSFRNRPAWFGSTALSNKRGNKEPTHSYPPSTIAKTPLAQTLPMATSPHRRSSFLWEFYLRIFEMLWVVRGYAQAVLRGHRSVLGTCVRARARCRDGLPMRHGSSGLGGRHDWSTELPLPLAFRRHAPTIPRRLISSQVKGKDIDAIRREIDDEIREPNKQEKNAMRDSEGITQQMIMVSCMFAGRLLLC